MNVWLCSCVDCVSFIIFSCGIIVIISAAVHSEGLLLLCRTPSPHSPHAPVVVNMDVLLHYGNKGASEWPGKALQHIGLHNLPSVLLLSRSKNDLDGIVISRSTDLPPGSQYLK